MYTNGTCLALHLYKSILQDEKKSKRGKKPRASKQKSLNECLKECFSTLTKEELAKLAQALEFLALQLETRQPQKGKNFIRRALKCLQAAAFIWLKVPDKDAVEKNFYHQVALVFRRGKRNSRLVSTLHKGFTRIVKVIRTTQVRALANYLMQLVIQLYKMGKYLHAELLIRIRYVATVWAWSPMDEQAAKTLAMRLVLLRKLGRDKDAENYVRRIKKICTRLKLSGEVGKQLNLLRKNGRAQLLCDIAENLDAPPPGDTDEYRKAS